MVDQASGTNEVEIQLKLKQTDAKILQAIEEALYRLEKGVYGLCRDCGDPISEAPGHPHGSETHRPRRRHRGFAGCFLKR